MDGTQARKRILGYSAPGNVLKRENAPSSGNTDEEPLCLRYWLAFSVAYPLPSFTPAELRAIAECAETFSSGKVIFTARLAAEIVGIPFDQIPEAEQFMAERGLCFGGTGAKVRPITACKGTTCVYGNIDTQAIAKVIYDTFYIGMRDVTPLTNSRSVLADAPTVV